MKDIHAEGTLTRDEHSTQSLYIKRDTHGHARATAGHYTRINGPWQ